MSKFAAVVERVEMIAEHDAKTGKPPAGRTAINEAIGRVYGRLDRALAEESPWLASKDRPSPDDAAMLMERYGLFYGATMAAGEGESPDELVRRWKGINDA